MKYIKTFEFPSVDVVAFKVDYTDESDDYGIKFIATDNEANIEMTPSFETLELRDFAWENDSEKLAKVVSIMFERSFVNSDD